MKKIYLFLAILLSATFVSASASVCNTPEIILPNVDYGMSDEDCISVVITCSTPGATIHYVTYNLDDNPNGNVNPEDYQVYDPENKPTLMCSGNYGVKAYASKEGMEDSNVATFIFTYHQYGRATSISDFIFQGEITMPKTYMHLLHCQTYVTAQSADGNYTFIRDNNNDAIMINGNLGKTLSNGQSFPGKALAAQSIEENGTYMMAAPRLRYDVMSDTYPDKTLPFEKTISEISTDAQSQYIVIKGVGINSTNNTIFAGDATLPFNLERFNVSIPEGSYESYDAVGVVELSNGAPLIAVTEFIPIGTPTGVDHICKNSAKVLTSAGTITVEGNAAASIYNVAGQTLVANSKAGTFAVPAGIYFVNVNGKVTKVVVR